MRTTEEFWERVDQSAGLLGCWPWTMETGPATWYGMIRWRGQITRTHRVAWEVAVGPIPDGLSVLHRCDNPPCCNPAHLFLGTQLDNNRDRHVKGRTRTGRLRGEQVRRARITEADVRSIRQRCAAGEMQKTLAREYGLHKTAVSLIVRRVNWRHVV